MNTPAETARPRVARILAETPDATLAEIASRCGISQPWASRLRKQLQPGHIRSPGRPKMVASSYEYLGATIRRRLYRIHAGARLLVAWEINDDPARRFPTLSAARAELDAELAALV